MLYALPAPLSQDAFLKKQEPLPRLRLRQGAHWLRRKLARAPRADRIVGGMGIPLVAFALTDLVYHVVRKLTELFLYVGHALDKGPSETWRQYGC